MMLVRLLLIKIVKHGNLNILSLNGRMGNYRGSCLSHLTEQTMRDSTADPSVQTEKTGYTGSPFKT